MLAAKMDIGAHGVQHYDLSQMTAGQQAYQIDDSITTLQHRLHTQIRSYAYPSGRFNRETLALVRQADVPIGVTTDAAFVLPPENPYEITRLRISGDWSIGDFERALRAVQQNRRSVEAGNGFPPPASSAALQGTIAAIHGTRVLISRGKTAITIDDSQAIKNGMAQNLYVGRAITAYGYWSDGTFFATSIA
jgi:peptidoglycan/xylan/chitin deacetylase (PgdA/CDA1 family)